jgi:hypothetical protein
VHDAAGSPADFNPASPDGSYTLDLSIAAERAVAVQLAELDRANSSGSGPAMMRNISVDGKVSQLGHEWLVSCATNTELIVVGM